MIETCNIYIFNDDADFFKMDNDIILYAEIAPDGTLTKEINFQEAIFKQGNNVNVYIKLSKTPSVPNAVSINGNFFCTEKQRCKLNRIYLDEIADSINRTIYFHDIKDPSNDINDFIVAVH